MDFLSTAERTDLQSDMEASMLDTCVIGTKGEGGQYTDGETTYACSLVLGNPGETVDRGKVNVQEGKLFLPIGTPVTRKNRITVTHQFGVELSESIELAILGNPVNGVSAMILEIEVLTGSSAK